MSIDIKKRWLLWCWECDARDIVHEASLVQGLELAHLRWCGIVVKAQVQTYLVDPSQLDDTSDCTRRERCENCRSTKDVAVSTVRYTVGVVCLGLCASCTSQNLSIGLSFDDVTDRVAEHCEHLGIDLGTLREAVNFDGYRGGHA
ncbi:hypothetical protein GCM10022223_47160 [Kineosporia mesophila]|uniref:Uncharacterized protein n=1 Tax=Kineosporia mesophila TaxID=566012 RepID=A0ABP7A483_9ACTN|nr:hypothetical protein [Kineosporia mesophila]MCD5353824.1 hypothetical protein [Kineosporia mesophila]